MAPNSTCKDTYTGDGQGTDVDGKMPVTQAAPRQYKIAYFNLLYFGYWHLAALYGLYLCFTSAKWATIVFAFILYVGAELGITAGAHRLWSHRSYKAKLPLQLILLVLNSLAFQNTATEWVRDHRLHHKYSDTDADPHNASRGFFYSHMGWLLVRKHPLVKEKGKTIDMSDIYADPLLRFQKRACEGRRDSSTVKSSRSDQVV
ncbi:hypothetical protein EVAR_27666_1 [Eumeta japonica]|uniref:Fatty acid desaturase domain-containing protein n=1 Tax=Eumeta variegata TaxID=151549 RepID=A0A4C1V1S7_EUMVA|nr:hypothetical protein EVAR_27666_1 [Eumeta japonica]